MTVTLDSRLMRYSPKVEIGVPDPKYEGVAASMLSRRDFIKSALVGSAGLGAQGCLNQNRFLRKQSAADILRSRYKPKEGKLVVTFDSVKDHTYTVCDAGGACKSVVPEHTVFGGAEERFREYGIDFHYIDTAHDKLLDKLGTHVGGMTWLVDGDRIKTMRVADSQLRLTEGRPGLEAAIRTFFKIR